MIDDEPEMPFEVLEAAAEHFHVDELHETVAKQSSALHHIADEAIAAAGDHPAKHAIDACALMRAASNEHDETGTYPPETMADARALAVRVLPRPSFVERLEMEPGTIRGIG